MKTVIISLCFLVLWVVVIGVIMESILHIQSHSAYAFVGAILAMAQMTVLIIFDK